MRPKKKGIWWFEAVHWLSGIRWRKRLLKRDDGWTEDFSVDGTLLESRLYLIRWTWVERKNGIHHGSRFCDTSLQRVCFCSQCPTMGFFTLFPFCCDFRYAGFCSRSDSEGEEFQRLAQKRKWKRAQCLASLCA